MICLLPPNPAVLIAQLFWLANVKLIHTLLLSGSEESHFDYDGLGNDIESGLALVSKWLLST